MSASSFDLSKNFTFYSYKNYKNNVSQKEDYADTQDFAQDQYRKHFNVLKQGNVNVLLGGAMISLMTIITCVICFCCHKTIKRKSHFINCREQGNNLSNPGVYSIDQTNRDFDLEGNPCDGRLENLTNNYNDEPPSYSIVMSRKSSSLKSPLNQTNSTNENLNLTEIAFLPDRQLQSGIKIIHSDINHNNSYCTFCGRYRSSPPSLNISSDEMNEDINGSNEDNAQNLSFQTASDGNNNFNGNSFFSLNYSNPEQTDVENNNINSLRPFCNHTYTISQNDNIDLGFLNETGIIHMDMSQIMDSTGLPTYDAAIKLNSSGYV